MMGVIEIPSVGVSLMTPTGAKAGIAALKFDATWFTSAWASEIYEINVAWVHIHTPALSRIIFNGTNLVSIS